MDLSRQIVVRFDHPTTIPLFRPGIWRWADALSSAYQSANPILGYFQWCQGLVSRVCGMCQSMQPLTSVTPQPWLPRDYFVWFIPEWHRGLLPLLLTEEPLSSTVEPEGGAAFLRGALESDMSLPTEAASQSRETAKRSRIAQRLPSALGLLLNLVTGLPLPAERGNLWISTSPGSMRQKEFLAASAARHERLEPHYAKLRKGLEWMDDILRYPGDDVEGTSSICHPERSERAQSPQSLRSIRIVAKSTEANQLTEKAHVEPIRAEWQSKATIITPSTLGATGAPGDVAKQGIWLEAMSARTGGDQTGHRFAYLEKLLTLGQDFVLPQKQDIHDVSSMLPESPAGNVLRDAAGSLVKLLGFRSAALGAKDITPGANSPSFGGIAEPLPEHREIVRGFSGLEALASMSPNFHHLLPQAEAQDMVMYPSSQLGKSNFHPTLAEAQAFGIPLMEPPAVADETPLGGRLLPQMPSNSAWGTHYAQARNLFLVPQTSVGSWEMRPIDVTEWGEQVGYGEPATHVVGSPSVNLAKPTGPSDLALAPLARPQDGSPTSPSPGAEANPSLGAEQAEGAEEADPEALACEVYKIIKQRLLVEREQARGMV